MALVLPVGAEDPAGSSEFEEQSAEEAEVLFLVAPTLGVTCQSVLFKMLEGSSTFMNGIAGSDCSLFHYVGLLLFFLGRESGRRLKWAPAECRPDYVKDYLLLCPI